MADHTGFFAAMGDKVTAVIEKKKRYYFEVKDEDLGEVVRYLFHTMGCRLSTATTTELYRGIEVLYHFSHDKTGIYFCPRIIMADKIKPRMHSITPIVRGAEWIEREMTELTGVEFIGHPRQEPLLSRNNPDFPKQPLRVRRVS